MTIAIDASRIVNEEAGIGRYTRELIKTLIEIDTKNKYILFFSYFKKDKEKEKIIRSFDKKNVEIRTLKLPGQIKEFVWGLPLPALNKIVKGADVFLATSFFEYNRGLRIPQVVIIYDLSTFLFPDQRGEKVSIRLNERTRLATNRAKKIITISESTKKDMIKILKIDSQKIHVIYPGLIKFPNIAKDFPIDFKICSKKYILFCGTIEPRKNLVNLIKAYKSLAQEIRKSYPLVIVGANGWNNKKEFQEMQDENIKYLGRVSDEVLAKLYLEAKLFVYPSLYEGFGMPIIEALQFGTPVLTSSLSSMPEAGGDGATYCNPCSTSDIAEKMTFMLQKVESENDIKSRKKQASKFSYIDAAKQTLDVLEKAVEK